MLILWVFLAFPGFFAGQAAPLAWAVAVGVMVGALFLPGVGDRVLAALRRPSTRTFLMATAAIAALLSYLIVSGPMRDRPSSIDAHVYLLEARALSHGHFGMPIPEPRQLFGGRFLFAGDDGHLYGVFPPGFPLFLVPFVWLGVPMLVGPVLAALLVGAQWLLGRSLERDGEDSVATRLAIVLSLPSVGRAVETADLLSHAFVAVLGTVAIALAIEERKEGSRWRLLAIGAALGWATIARLLDGVVLCGLVAAVLAGRVPLRRAFVPLLTLLPFVTFLLFAQKAATGSFTVPTQSIFFARSDWPPTCHRLGFGVDVGCAVEHEAERASFGPDGYTLGDAVRIVRERASALGSDLFGFAPMALFGFAAVIARARRRDAFLAASVVVFTLAYGLFYYGNAPVFGARHLFPIAPLFWMLVARALVEPIHPRVGTSLVASALVVASFAAVPRWVLSATIMRNGAQRRVDLRAVIDKAELQKGLVVTGDELSFLAGFDPYRDGRDRVVVRFDGSGLKDLRRMYPELPVHAVLENDILQTQQLAVPPPGVHVELERAWPSFVRPHDLGAKVVNTKNCCNVESSGERALFVFVAKEGAALTIPFAVPRAGRFALRVDGLSAPDYGTWSIRVDEHALPDWDGYAPTIARKQGPPSAPIELAAGPHTLTFKCTGKHAESRGHLATFDTLIGTPSP